MVGKGGKVSSKTYISSPWLKLEDFLESDESQSDSDSDSDNDEQKQTKTLKLSEKEKPKHSSVAARLYMRNKKAENKVTKSP